MSVFALGNRAKETSTTTGTGTYSLTPSVDSKYQTLVAAVTEAMGGASPWSRVLYCVSDGTDYEIGYGTLTDAATDTLTRADVRASSNGGAAVNWGAGTRDVIICVPADLFVTRGDISYTADTGTADALAIAPALGLAALLTGQIFAVKKSAAANTGACTLNPDGTGAVNIKMMNGNDPPAGALPANGMLIFLYDGTNAVLVSSPPGQGSPHWFHSSATVAAGATVYIQPQGYSVTESVSQLPMPQRFRVSRLYAISSANAGGGQTFTYTVRKNGVATTLTCQIAGATNVGQDTTNSVEFANGDLLSIEIVTSGGAGVGVHRVGLMFDRWA